jgi:hypothetical protein
LFKTNVLVCCARLCGSKLSYEIPNEILKERKTKNERKKKTVINVCTMLVTNVAFAIINFAIIQINIIVLGSETKIVDESMVNAVRKKVNLYGSFLRSSWHDHVIRVSRSHPLCHGIATGSIINYPIDDHNQLWSQRYAIINDSFLSLAVFEVFVFYPHSYVFRSLYIPLG